MKNQKPNAEMVWKQLEDVLVPRLALSVNDRAAYSHLLPHSRLEGKLRLLFSIPWLARGMRLSSGPAREAVRRLVGHGALLLVERTKAGHVVEVRLDLEEIDFLRNSTLRKAIHTRERSVCFYCLRRLNPTVQCLDHVIPKVRLGANCYRNLVSCCLECNSAKGEKSAADLLRRLYREGRLTSAELTARLRALDALAAGKLRPTLAAPTNPTARQGRSPRTCRAAL